MGISQQNNYSFKEKELNTNYDYNLCSKDSSLDTNSVGWSRNPKHNCHIKGHCFRKKKFNYWNICNQDYLFNITVTNFDYVGLISIYLLDIKNKTQTEESFKIPFAIGCTLPNKVYGNINISKKNFTLSISNNQDKTELQVYCSNFSNNTLKGKFIIDNNPKHETLNIVIPWSTRKFHFTSKQNCLPVSGELCIGKSKPIFFELNNSFASLDFGRGIWPYNTFWNWCSFSDRHKGLNIGINLGSGWTDDTGLNENAITINDKIIKISDDVEFIYNKNNMMDKWYIRTKNSNKIDLLFSPFIEKHMKTNFLVVKSDFCQLYGYFSGKIVDEDNKDLNINNLFGTVEEHTAKW
ncbi:DUF2804 domain-containing protein [Haloimpatiens lingqiaonensis]|uniref:DUF2804 domain-containing protein n=1 Tax=Haloimpatiens lingqiaonensis TaxID=1380675 RepID=UPI0010FE8D79|nr:DUF2804 domain-containing protein [Haloimpatiens lingqiaonensis]